MVTASAGYDIMQNAGEDVGCFGTGCRTRGASLGEGAYICSEQIYVKRNDKIGQTGCDNQGEACLPRAAGECAAGVGGDGDRIGGERLGCQFEIVGEPYQSDPSCLTI